MSFPHGVLTSLMVNSETATKGEVAGKAALVLESGTGGVWPYWKGTA